METGGVQHKRYAIEEGLGRRRSSRLRKQLRTFWLLSVFVAATFLSATASAGPSGLTLKVDRVRLRSPNPGFSAPTRINFRQSYSTPPLVFLLPGNGNADPSTIRVVRVSTTGFEVWTTESDTENGITGLEELHYLAIEPGRYTLPGGVEIQAGTTTTTQRQSGAGDSTGYATINFAPAFSGPPPVVLHEVQSFANDPTYPFNSTALTRPFLETVSLQANTTNTTASIALERAETTAGSVTANETIAWLAISPGAASFSDNASSAIGLNAAATAVNIDDDCSSNPHGLSGLSVITIASQASRAGGNGGWLRHCGTDSINTNLRVQEDRNQDSETGHTFEAAAILSFTEAFDASGAGPSPRWEAGEALVGSQNTAGGLSFTTVSFPTAFASTPLIFALPTSEGDPPASLRIKNASPTGFEISQVAPQGEAGAPESMTVDYIAVVPGVHTLTDGTTIIEAGFLDTSAFQGRNTPGASYAPLSFAQSFNAPPALLLDVQTVNSEPGLDPNQPTAPWLEVTVESGSLTTTGARIALERAETSNGSVVSERIAYLVAEDGIDTTLVPIGGGSIDFKVTTSTNDIVGVGNNICHATGYSGGGFGAAPLAVAQQVTRNGADGGWLRRCSLSANTIGLQVDEDRSQDLERSHTSETASIFAFEGAFEWCPAGLEISKNVRVIRDPVNELVNPKAIPGALVRYAIQVQNESGVPVDSGSTAIVDAIPAETAVFVESSAAYPEPTFIFLDGAGAASSGLVFNYAGPASTTDDVEFSDDGGASFGYEPVPDADGFDSDVTDIRLNPKGQMSGGSAGNAAGFTIEFGVRVE